MRAGNRFTLGLIVLATAAVAFYAPRAAAQLAAEGEDLDALVRSWDGVNSTEVPRFHRTDEGFIRFVGAPPDTHFDVTPSVTKGLLKGTAAGSAFIEEHRGAFGLLSDNSSLTVDFERTGSNYIYTRFTQLYGGIPVFGAAVNVQVDAEGNVISVLSDVLRDTRAFDAGEISLTPLVSRDGAINAAIDATASQNVNVKQFDLDVTTPELVVYAPSVIGRSGTARLAWRMTVRNPVVGGLIEDTFVDAHTGRVLFQYSLRHDLKLRLVQDFVTGTTRAEGQLPVDIPEVDDAYDFLGDTFDFYNDVHGRDCLAEILVSGQLVPVVADTLVNIPDFINAFWDTVALQLVFGEGFEIDDVVAHEFTHGVTQFTSGLIFFGESGAMNESFSDMWGEFVDLSNNGGDDSDEVRWLIGEDFTEDILRFFVTTNPPARALRSMKDPADFGWFPFDRTRMFLTPDRYNHRDFYRGIADNAGVHFNSGVGNKLAYLLTDGDDFNGRRVAALGLVKTAQLLYEAQANLLTPASDYFDLFFALGQAAINLQMNIEDRRTIRQAAEAVEIVPQFFEPFDSITNLRAVSAQDVDLVQLTWSLGLGAAPPLRIVRRQGAFPGSQFDGTFVGEMFDDNIVDDGILEFGQEYFYGIFSDDTVFGLPGADFARVTVGAPPPNFLTEAFDEGTDLSFKQILFTPVFDEGLADQSGRKESYVNYTSYAASVTTGISELPIKRDDPETGQSFNLSFQEDDFAVGTLPTPVPYFGRLYNNIVIAANGYVTFDGNSLPFGSNFPSVAGHFSIPRISPLFSDLALSIGGSIWSKFLDDRIVVTWEGVPEFLPSPFSSPPLSTVQLEIFYSGHIRFTYLDVTVQDAVVGLSDGRGVPVDPSNFFLPEEMLTDFTADFGPDMPDSPLIWPPIPAQFVSEGDLVTFTAETVVRPGQVPLLEATWDRPEPIDFETNPGSGRGTFRWQTESLDVGVTRVLVRARLGDTSVTQTVPIVVTNTLLTAQAVDLRLRTNEEGETDAEAAQNRTVSVDAMLEADYTYFHPSANENPSQFAEGPTIIQWFRNNVLVASLQNALEVPASATRQGDEWSFTIVPVTESFMLGEPAMSPIVTIEGKPVIDSIAPSNGEPRGGDVVRITGSRLLGPQSVRFGGIPAPNVRSISSTEIEVVTPANFEGLVDVSVTTFLGGTTVSRNAFTYGPDVKNFDADVNGDGSIDAIDVQIVIVAMMEGQGTKAQKNADVNDDGFINSQDLQSVVNEVLRR